MLAISTRNVFKSTALNRTSRSITIGAVGGGEGVPRVNRTEVTENLSDDTGSKVQGYNKLPRVVTVIAEHIVFNVIKIVSNANQ